MKESDVSILSNKSELFYIKNSIPEEIALNIYLSCSNLNETSEKFIRRLQNISSEELE